MASIEQAAQHRPFRRGLRRRPRRGARGASRDQRDARTLAGLDSPFACVQAPLEYVHLFRPKPDLGSERMFASLISRLPPRLLQACAYAKAFAFLEDQPASVPSDGAARCRPAAGDPNAGLRDPSSPPRATTPGQCDLPAARCAERHVICAGGRARPRTDEEPHARRDGAVPARVQPCCAPLAASHAAYSPATQAAAHQPATQAAAYPPATQPAAHPPTTQRSQRRTGRPCGRPVLK